MRPLTRRAAREDGAISVMAAAMMLAILMSTALAVDVGRVAYVSRDQQGVTDRAALDAVPVLDQVPVGTPMLSEWWIKLVTGVDATTAGNLIESMGTEVLQTDHSIRDVVPGEPLTYAEAVRRALAEDDQG